MADSEEVEQTISNINTRYQACLSRASRDAPIERGRPIRFVQPVRVHDFLDRTIPAGSTGMCFWSGWNNPASQVRRRYYGATVDGTDIRVYVDQDAIIGQHGPSARDRERCLKWACTHQDKGEVPFATIFNRVHARIPDMDLYWDNDL